MVTTCVGLDESLDNILEISAHVYSFANLAGDAKGKWLVTYVSFLGKGPLGKVSANFFSHQLLYARFTDLSNGAHRSFAIFLKPVPFG